MSRRRPPPSVFRGPSFYHAQTLFQQGGLAGLIPRRPGPQQAHKLSEEVLDFVQQQLSRDTQLRATQMQELLLQEYGLVVHPRSIERALKRRLKKGR